MNERKIQSWLPLLLGVVLAIGMAGGYRLQNHLGNKTSVIRQVSSGSVNQVLNLIKEKYVDSISFDSIEIAAIETITRQLDPHSVFIPGSSMEDIEADLAGSFSGIGVEYQMIRDTLFVVQVLENGPAAKAGLLAGDAITAVNDSGIAGVSLNTTQLRDLLRGKKGSLVKVKILRNSRLISKDITRGDVPYKSVDTYYMAAKGVGYLKINRFAETTFFEFMDAMSALQKSEMKSLIIDLRGNGGGLLEEATKIADELLEDGLEIVTTKGAKVKENLTIATKPGVFEKGDLVILIDEQSASASEVLAGALQDHDRATIIGRRSFGKGLVQEQYSLANGGALRLTVARYFTPLGRGIQKDYKQDPLAYTGEVFNRIHTNGNSVLPDTTGKRKFLTRKGKTLYEAGGIWPDMVVPFDTTTVSKPLLRLYNSDLYDELVFDGYRDNINNINNYKDPLDFNRSFLLSRDMWQWIVSRSAGDSIALNKLTTTDKGGFEWRYKAQLARYKWGAEGYFKLMNNHDPLFMKALEYLQEEKKQ
ncbi:MAG: S41 family peptidase [Chitinophagaceae bacterium]|nr:S41 family peptidase [Chitinophagaceae bacterium]